MYRRMHINYMHIFLLYNRSEYPWIWASIGWGLSCFCPESVPYGLTTFLVGLFPNRIFFYLLFCVTTHDFLPHDRYTVVFVHSFHLNSYLINAYMLVQFCFWLYRHLKFPPPCLSVSIASESQGSL